MTRYTPKQWKNTPYSLQQNPCFNQSITPEGKTTTEAVNSAVEIPHNLLLPQLNQKSEDENALKEGTRAVTLWVNIHLFS